MYLHLFLLIQGGVIVYSRAISTEFISHPCPCYFLHRLSLEIELRFCVDDLLDQFKILLIEEVSIRFVFWWDSKDLPVEF